MADLLDTLTLRLRAAGAAAVKGALTETAAATKRTGEEAATTAKKSSLLGKATKGMLAPFHHLKSEAIGMAKSLAAAGLAFGTFEGVKNAIEKTDDLVKTTISLKEQFGFTTKAASTLGGVIQERDLSVGSLRMGMVALSKQMEQAVHGSKNAQGAFRHLGMNTDAVTTAFRSKDGLVNTFNTVVDQLSHMHGNGIKSALASQLLGRAFHGLAPLMQSGALSMKAQEHYARMYGDTLDESTIGKTEDMVVAQTKAKYAMAGLQIQMGMFFAPIVTKASLVLANVVKSFRDGKPTGDHFARTIYKIGTDLKPVYNLLKGVGGFLKDHPRLLQAAALAWVAYKLKVFSILGVLFRIPFWGAKGFASGLAYGRGFTAGVEAGGGAAATAMEAEVAGPAVARSFTLLGMSLGTALVGGLGLAVGGGIAYELIKHGVPQWLANKITGIDPKKTAAQNRRTSAADERNAVGLAREGTTITYPDPAHGFRPTTVHGGRVPKINLEAVVHNHVHMDGKEVARSTRRVALKQKATR